MNLKTLVLDLPQTSVTSRVVKRGIGASYFRRKKELAPFELTPWHYHWCERGDSNPHTRRCWILSPVRLPVPPLSHYVWSLLSSPHPDRSGSLPCKPTHWQAKLRGQVLTWDIFLVISLSVLLSDLSSVNISSNLRCTLTTAE